MVTYKEEFYAASYHKTKNPNDDIEAYIYIYILRFDCGYETISTKTVFVLCNMFSDVNAFCKTKLKTKRFVSSLAPKLIKLLCIYGIY